MLIDRMCWVVFCEFFGGILCLYIWYSHITLFSNDCVCGFSPCELYLDVLYCCHSHLCLVVGMVVRYPPVFSYRWVCSFFICMVSLLVMMAYSGYILVWICVRVKLS